MSDTTRGFDLKIVQPTPERFGVLEVRVGATDLLLEYATGLVNYAKSVAGQDHYPEVAPSPQEIAELLRYILKRACLMTQGKAHPGGINDYQVPTFFFVAVQAIEYWQDHSEGTNRVAVYCGNCELKPEEADDIAMRLSWLSPYIHLRSGCLLNRRSQDDLPGKEPTVMDCGIVGDAVYTESKSGKVAAPLIVPLLGIQFPKGRAEALLDLHKLFKVSSVWDAKVNLSSNPSLY